MVLMQNLAKLATGFGSVLVDAAAAPVSSEDADGVDATEQVQEKFSVDELLDAAVSSVEWSIGQLLRVLQTSSVADLGALKFLKLYWRAFQRLMSAFANNLECEMENCILVVVNVTSSLIYAVRHNQIPATSKPSLELRAMLGQAMDLADNLAGSGNSAINDQVKDAIRSLLWYPAGEMVRAVGQRQPPDITGTDIENSIRWGHLLVLTTFGGTSRNDGSRTDADVLYDDGNRAVEVSQLFARYRECALSDSASRLVELTGLFTDAILRFLLCFENVVEMEFSLLKQSLYPNWSQRTLCWEIWRELLCFCWDEALSVQTLQMLLDVAQWEDGSDKGFVLSDGVEDEILQLVAYIYQDMPLALKDVCMDQLTAVIDLISNEGPGHQFNTCVASQLHLLEKMAGVCFLKVYDGPMKDDWIAKYLPMCFECCGTVLELLATDKKNPTSERETILGMMRVLDMCLLVLRGVLDNTDPGQEDVAELSIILVRVSTEALSQLAKQSKRLGCVQSIRSNRKAIKQRTSSSVKLEKSASCSIGRAIETSLYLLSKLGAVLKSNKNNQFVQVLKDLLTIIDSRSQLEGAGETFIITARFAESTLYDMQVAESDMDVVWQLLFALFQKLFDATSSSTKHQNNRLSLLLSVCLNAFYKLLARSNIADFPGAPLKNLLVEDLTQLFRESVLMRKLSQEEVVNALESARAGNLQVFLRDQNDFYRVFRERFPDEPTGLYADTNESTEEPSIAQNKRSADDSEGLPQKRHKLTHFVSLCREIESSLSTISNDEAAANILSGKELDDATAILHRLLAKTITFCT
ncbi:unnamed protein product [Phytophthora fragariaefolia]|uniref:Unnamed protein product n=1 Tax=Phytophthora fragariaefolia TaxID=1490495 RepID=A0A9W6U284_9STRA|nr:unnamed protein product [Phytophthora fragariaefolia]